VSDALARRPACRQECPQLTMLGFGRSTRAQTLAGPGLGTLDRHAARVNATLPLGGHGARSAGASPAPRSEHRSSSHQQAPERAGGQGRG